MSFVLSIVDAVPQSNILISWLHASLKCLSRSWCITVMYLHLPPLPRELGMVFPLLSRNLSRLFELDVPDLLAQMHS